VGPIWDWKHPTSDNPEAVGTVSVMPDLAAAMKLNPALRVLVAGGYFDLATPYYSAVYTARHLPIPASLNGNVSYCFFAAGHMGYVNPDALKRVHDCVGAFIDGAGPPGG